MSIDVRASGNDLELWHVQLGGVVRPMSLDELDAAFQAGVIDAHTKVLQAGTLHWTTLGNVAGIDDQPNSIAPVAADAASSGIVIPPEPRFDVSLLGSALDTSELAAFRPKRRAARILAAVAVVALAGGALFGVQRHGVDDVKAKIASVTSLVRGQNADSARAAAGAPMLVAEPAAPTSPPPSAPVENLPATTPVESLPAASASVAGVSIDSLPSASVKTAGKADKNKKGKRSAEPAPRRKSGAKAKSKASSNNPTSKGSGQFDPLDGKL